MSVLKEKPTISFNGKFLVKKLKFTFHYMHHLLCAMTAYASPILSMLITSMSLDVMFFSIPSKAGINDSPNSPSLKKDFKRL